ncbi:gluconate 2-dehydrogenase subunit 3 family protein [Hymenobacter sp.]|jgi:hypothetical protein|uniref:gluconate 2-dehydrogenase subunit 3 family protein n=1 Tax=Hymenobacter sp. TaxID=1898978 RepID=UPI002ED96126
MNRRSAVRNLSLVIGGALLLPSCYKEAAKETQASIALKHLKVSAAQEELLAQVCETILPKTDTPGARDLGLHLRVLKMLDDCTFNKHQRLFFMGLKQLEKTAQLRHKLPFAECTTPQRLALLQNHKRGPVELAAFCSMARQLTVDAYTGSKYYMTTQVVYELVPSRYNGYFPTKDLVLNKPRNGQS